MGTASDYNDRRRPQSGLRDRRAGSNLQQDSVLQGVVPALDLALRFMVTSADVGQRQNYAEQLNPPRFMIGHLPDRGTVQGNWHGARPGRHDYRAAPPIACHPWIAQDA